MTTKAYHIRPILVPFLMLFLFSCGGSKQVASASGNSDQIITYALSLENTPYRYGGTTQHGMDCSGLIYNAFLKHGKELPRTTKGLSTYGQKIKLSKVSIGDLMFFKTSKKGRGINHVALVVEVSGDQISFIHSTTSRGVIVSDFSESYWSRAFRYARRVL